MINDNKHKDDISLENFEILFSNESFKRQQELFIPIPGLGVPSVKETYRPNFNFVPPSFDYDTSPNFNYPGGGVFNPPGVPKSPPPNYAPNKNDTEVQKVGLNGSVNSKAVSANSIRFCLYKYTYIWENNGKSYWAFLLNINRNTISGFRWFRRNWVYFGLDLKRIDSFVCYRSDSENNLENHVYLNRNCNSLLSDTQKEYSINGIRDIYTKTLISINIPEIKEKDTDCLKNNDIASRFAALKNIPSCYKINLEVTYPSEYNIELKSNINELVDHACNEAYKIISLDRYNYGDPNPLELFDNYTELIPRALKTFSNSFNNELKTLDIYSLSKDIAYSIRINKSYNN